ncbi:unnamed protein product, partial [marine sediment metagenome]
TDKLEMYLKDLEERYKYYYEVERDKEISDAKVDIFAKSSTEHFRQVLTKSIKIDQHYNKEYAVVKAEKRFIDKNEVKEFSQFLISSINKLSHPSVDTMSTILNGILISVSGFSEEAVSFAKKFKFSKSFLFGIKGWCDIRLILVDLKEEKLYSNKKGKEVLSAYKIKSPRGGDNT